MAHQETADLAELTAVSLILQRSNNAVEDMNLFEAMYTQLGITRYRPDPVPREVIDKIIEAATQAPSGGNRQHWEFIAITDPEIIAQVGNVYREVWLESMGAQPQPDEKPAYSTARYLANHMPEVPAMILACVDHDKGYLPTPPGQSINTGSYASSIWPAAQNLMLAARAMGLGTRLTTAFLRGEERIRDILGVPDNVEMVMLTPLGYPRGSFGSVRRVPAAEVTSYNRYGNRE